MTKPIGVSHHVVNKPGGAQPGYKPSFNNNYYDENHLSATRPSNMSQRPLLATSPSNKISSSPNLVGGSGFGQRGTARPMTSNTLNDIQPQESVGLGMYDFNNFIFHYLFFIFVLAIDFYNAAMFSLTYISPSAAFSNLLTPADRKKK